MKIACLQVILVAFALWGLGAGCRQSKQSVGGNPEQIEVIGQEHPASDANGQATGAWAEPLELEGVENFHQVSPSLYRGAQPTAQGFKNLQAMGIRTVVNLRWMHSDRDKIRGTELGYEHITFNPLHPEDKEVVRFLKIVNESSNHPIFVHCAYGSDRTGMMCAIYRVAVQGWGKEAAIAEWTEGDFGFHDVYQDLIKYVRELDIARMKRLAGMD